MAMTVQSSALSAFGTSIHPQPVTGGCSETRQACVDPDLLVCAIFAPVLTAVNMSPLALHAFTSGRLDSSPRSMYYPSLRKTFIPLQLSQGPRHLSLH
jgi:hypothetical protein